MFAQVLGNLLVLFTLAAGQPADTQVRELLGKAIEAHGGEAALSRNRVDRVKLKGILQVQGREMPFEAETLVRLPDGFRNQITLTPPMSTPMILIQLMHEGKASLYVNGAPQASTEAQLQELRETLLINQAMRLVPLVREKNFRLEWLGEGQVNGRPVDGIGVSAPGRRSVRLWFDRQTAYLVRTAHPVLVDGEMVVQEETYGDFRLLGAYRRPVRMVTTRAGKKLMDAELVDVRYPEKISEAEFLAP